MYPTSLLWTLQSVIRPCIEEAENKIGLGDLRREGDQVLRVCVCVCVCMHMSRKRWEE